MLGLTVVACLWSGCTKIEPEFAGPEIVRIDPGEIDAAMDQRRAWVQQQTARDPQWFAEDYGWILNSKTIGRREAQQLAYLFF